MSIIEIYAEYGFYYLANVNNKYMQNMACIIWLMSIISNEEYGLYYLANVNNKYMHNMACIIWLISIISIYSILLVLSG